MARPTNHRQGFAQEAYTLWQAHKETSSTRTLALLANAMRVDVKAVTQMLNGHTLPQDETLKRFCHALGLNAAQHEHLEQLVHTEKAARHAPMHTVGFLYPGVEEASHFWYRAATFMAKSVDDEDLFRTPGTTIPQFGVTTFCHGERKSRMLEHLRYFKALKGHLFALVIAPAFGLSVADNQNDDAIVQEIEYFHTHNIQLIFIDRKLIVGGSPSDLEDGIAIDVGAEKGIKLVTIDGYAAGQLAVNELLAKGHKAEGIAIAGDMQRLSTIYDRWRGASDTLRRHLDSQLQPIAHFGTELSEAILGQSPYGLDDVVQQILDHHPTAIVALTSQIALLTHIQLRKRIDEILQQGKSDMKDMPIPTIISLDDVVELGDAVGDYAIARVPYTPNQLITRAIEALKGQRDDTIIVPKTLRGTIHPPTTLAARWGSRWF